jgi:hypothetical protein
MTAVADTVIPGPSVDPDGSPGAVEACALDALYEPGGLAKPVLAVLVSDLDWASRLRYGKPFVDLDYDRRAAVLDARAHGPLGGTYFLAISVIKGAYSGNLP